MSLGVCCSIHHPSRQPRHQSHFDLHTDQRHLSPRTRKHGGGQRRMIREGGMAVVTSIAGRHCEKLRWPMTPLSMLPTTAVGRSTFAALIRAAPPWSSWWCCQGEWGKRWLHQEVERSCQEGERCYQEGERQCCLEGKGRGGDAARWRGGQLEVRESRRGRGVGYHICL